MSLAGHVGWDTPPNRVTERQIVRWLEINQLAPATVRNRLSTVRGFYKWAIINGHARKDPTLAIDPPREPRRRPRGLKADQVAAILDACPDVRAVLIVILMAQQGLRCIEIARLQLGDLDFDEKLMLVHGKGDHERILPITDETGEALRDYLAKHPARTGPLIRSYRDEHEGLTPLHVGTMVGRIMRDAGVAETAHALRHTAATDMVRAGGGTRANLLNVQAALGHQHLQTTQRYLPWGAGDLRKTMAGRRYRAR